jgi:hypothetical protein
MGARGMMHFYELTGGTKLARHQFDGSVDVVIHPPRGRISVSLYRVRQLNNDLPLCSLPNPHDWIGLITRTPSVFFSIPAWVSITCVVSDITCVVADITV